MIRRTTKHRRDRRMLTLNQPGRPGDAIPTLVSHIGAVITVTFDRIVQVIQPAGGDPPGWDDTTASKVAIGAALVTPTSVDVTFDGNVAASDLVTIPQGDFSIRTPQGGYVQAGTYKLAT